MTQRSPRVAIGQTLSLWRRYGLRQLYPWWVLLQTGCQWVLICGLERDRAAIRWIATLVKIDRIKLTAFLNDLIW
jgi:hypothetical protein